MAVVADKNDESFPRLAKSRPRSSFSTVTRNYPKETIKRIDYVIIHDNKTPDLAAGKKDQSELETKIAMRKKFLKVLKGERVEIQTEVQEERTIIRIHTPFARLCQEAERIKLEMPLEGVSLLWLIAFC